ncbi:Lrp/AsnC family transcriptional regulator [Sphingobium sp. CAP-1]|uniref:Lrp/AsnC family transcriptional regulator n=1 Tax=Sphingobium sp. CAP-1 TaxID=2676077 RepID=UPI0012BB4516|nr:Lrp/AsnC family transcriptional regulator [Sphingobium sp. CAP-1]QGP81255.1 AsnC family transcriptional regulator [Sphingobium sp. CAP-1]
MSREGEGRRERLDELDLGIVDRLARDARISNRVIAADLGVTEGTVRARIKRLQRERLIQFAVVTDFRMAGSPNLIMMGIKVDPTHISHLARQLSAIPEITCVVVLLGRYSLLAMGLFTSIEQMNDLVVEHIRSLPGVQSVEASISVDSLKYEAGIAKITRGPARE